MTRRLPVDAFDFYYALGPARSYQSVAAHFAVSKRTVTSLAVHEGWQQKVVDLERRARERSDTKIAETIEAMQTRHIKTLQAVLGRALEALRAMPLTSAMEAVRAIEMVLRQERLIRGDGGGKSFEEIEARVRGELNMVMVAPGEDDDDEPA